MGLQLTVNIYGPTPSQSQTLRIAAIPRPTYLYKYFFVGLGCLLQGVCRWRSMNSVVRYM